MSEHTLVLLIQERDALIVSHHVSQIGLNKMTIATVGNVESSDCERTLEWLILWII